MKEFKFKNLQRLNNLTMLKENMEDLLRYAKQEDDEYSGGKHSKLNKDLQRLYKVDSPSEQNLVELLQQRIKDKEFNLFKEAWFTSTRKYYEGLPIEDAIIRLRNSLIDEISYCVGEVDLEIVHNLTRITEIRGYK